jgi:hypothetical protein
MPAGRYDIVASLFPHVDEAWAQDFAMELRLLGVQGASIGDALSEVDSHCGESKESAQKAFGNSTSYARSLQLPRRADTSQRARLRSMAPTISQLLGMLVLVWAFAALRQGGRLEVTTAHLVTLTVFPLAVAVLVRFADPARRLVTHHPALLWVVFIVSTSAFTASFQFLNDVIWRIDARWSLGAGAIALFAGMVWAFARRRAQGCLDDPITSPFEESHAGANSASPGPIRRLFRSSLLGPVWTSFATGLLLAATWWLTR